MEHEAGVGLGGLGSPFLLRLPRFLEVSGTRFRAVAGNTYFLAVKLPTLNGTQINEGCTLDFPAKTRLDDSVIGVDPVPAFSIRLSNFRSGSA